MKPLVLYHAHCLDGFAAAFAAWKALGDSAEYHPINYNDVESPVNLIGMFGDHFEDRDVYILDFSFPREVMYWLFDNAGSVIWLDHHKSAFENWCNKAPCEGFQKFEPTPKLVGNYICLDNQKSGTYLAWEYFLPGAPVPLMFQHIDDRDRWQFKLDKTREFNAVLFSMQPWSFEQFDGILQKMQGPEGEEFTRGLYNEGVGILRDHDLRVRQTAERALKCQIKHPHGGDDVWAFANGLIVNCPPDLSSDVGHQLAEQCGTFGLCWYIDASNRVKCSIRGSKNFDVDHIAKAFGGGGHAKASGFTITWGQLLDIMMRKD